MSNKIRNWIVRRAPWLGLILCIAGLWQVFLLIRFSGNNLSVYNLGIDTQIYRDLAKLTAEKGLSAIHTGHPPGYITFLALFYLLFGNPIFTAKIAQLVLLTFICLFVYLTGRRVFSEATGIVAAVFTAWSPGLTAYAATIQYEVLATALLWAAVCFLYAYLEDRKRVLNLFVSSFLLSLGTLVREPVALFFLPVLLSSFLGNEARVTKFRAATINATLFIAPILAWIIFQWHSSGQLVPISAKSKINILIGANPLADGSFNVVRSGIGEPAGFDYIRAEPLAALSLLFKKVGYMLGVLRDGWNVPRVGSVLAWYLTNGLFNYKLDMLLARVLPLLAACAGSVLAYRRKLVGIAGLIYLLIATLGFYALFFGSYRFLLPVLPVIYLFAAYAIVSLNSRQIRTIGILGIVSYLVTSLVFPGFKLTISGAELDGSQVLNVSDFGSKNVQVLYAPPQADGRLIGFFPPEFFPRGAFEFAVRYRTDGQPGGTAGRMIIRKPNGRSLCMMNLSIPMDNNYFTATKSCETDGIGTLSVEIQSDPGTAVWIDEVSVRG